MQRSSVHRCSTCIEKRKFYESTCKILACVDCQLYGHFKDHSPLWGAALNCCETFKLMQEVPEIDDRLGL